MNKIDKLIVQLSLSLKDNNLTLVTAESCTGGGLSFYISENSACSSLLERGYVTYSNNSKQDLLGVKASSIQLYGAVSKQVALEMAKGALKNSAAQVSIAITGIAESDKKRGKGIVWISCHCILKNPLTKKFIISGHRKQFVKKVIEKSLEMLILYLPS